MATEFAALVKGGKLKVGTKLTRKGKHSATAAVAKDADGNVGLKVKGKFYRSPS